MKKRLIALIILAIFLVSFASSSSYFIEFNQVDDKIVVKESVNGTQNGSYVDYDSIEINGKEIYFLKKIIFSENFDKAIIKLKVDEGVIINNKLIFPSGYVMETDGRTIFLVWNLFNIKKGETFAIFVGMEDIKKSNLTFFYLFSIILIFFVFLWFFFFKKSEKRRETFPRSKMKKKKGGEEYSYLLDTEKKIIEELKKADRNELWQKQIQNSTGFSKAKVSRLVRTLESRGLIKKIPFGNTNKIRLK